MKLTKEELELIKNKREKQKSEEKEEYDKAVSNIKDTITSIISRNNRQIQATRDFVTELDSKDFTLYIQKVPDSRKREKATDEKDEKGFTVYKTLYKESFVNETAYIKYKNKPIDYPNIYINVKEHHTGSSWNYSSVGYRMFIRGCGYDLEEKAYKRPSTVINKIEGYIATNQREMFVEEKQNEFILLLQENPPIKGSKIKETLIYSGGYRGNRYDKYMYRYKGVKITLKNGVEMECSIRVDEKGNTKLIQHKTTIPKPSFKGSPIDILDKLNKLNFNFKGEKES